MNMKINKIGFMKADIEDKKRKIKKLDKEIIRIYGVISKHQKSIIKLTKEVEGDEIRK